MKIGFVLDDSLDRPDGVQQYVLTLGSWLKKNNHKVYYLVGQTNRHDIGGVHSLGRNLRVKFNGNVVGTPLPASKTKISKLLSSLKLDVLHVQLPYSPVLAGRVIKAADSSVAVVGTLHIYPNSKFEHGLNRLLTAINKRTLARFDKIVAVSNVAASASHLVNSRDIPVIPNPVDLVRFQKAKQIRGKKIVFLGRLVPRKGCLLLLQAVAGLKNQGKWADGWTVEVGGTGPLLASLETFVTKNSLNNVVSFKGYINEDDKSGFLSSAEIAVFPSSGGESFGIVLLEAMAAKTMVLAGDNPGYACVVGPSSPELFATSNSGKLCSLLANAMQSTSLRQKIVAIQSDLVKAYDIEVVGQQIEAVYTKALHSRGKMG